MVNFNISNENGPCGLSRRMWILAGGVGLILIITIIIIVAVASGGGTSNKRSGRSALDDVPLVDGYNNLAQLLRKCADNNVQKIPFNIDLANDTDWDDKCKTFTDLVRMEKGKLWAQVWYASAPCAIQYKDGTAYVLEQIDVLKRLHRQYSDRMQLVTSISDFKDAYSNQKISSWIGVDSGHVIDSRLGVLRMFYDLGVRFLTLSSCTGEDVTPWLINNRTKLTSFGEVSIQNDSKFNVPFAFIRIESDIIKEANRLGIVLDLTGLPTSTVTQVLSQTQAPVIFSHVASKTLHDNESNIDDHVLQQIKSNKGLVMISFDKNMITKNDTPTLIHLLEHFDKIGSIAGIDSVGVGSGFGLYGESITGVQDTSNYPELFDALYEYKPETPTSNTNQIDWHSIDHLKKVAYENFERILTEVEKVRDTKLNEEPQFKWITKAELDVVVDDHDEIEICRSNYDEPAADSSKTTVKSKALIIS